MLQKDIDHLTGWAHIWQLSFNAAKCKVLHLGRLNQEQAYKIDKDVSPRKQLRKTSLEYDFGVNVDKDLKLSRHTEIQVKKASRIICLIRRLYDYLDGDSIRKLHIALVRPVLEYGNMA